MSTTHLSSHIKTLAYSDQRMLSFQGLFQKLASNRSERNHSTHLRRHRMLHGKASSEQERERLTPGLDLWRHYNEVGVGSLLPYISWTRLFGGFGGMLRTTATHHGLEPQPLTMRSFLRRWQITWRKLSWWDISKCHVGWSDATAGVQ